MKEPIDSTYSVVRAGDGTFALMEIPVRRIILGKMRRHDLIKIMSDISNWLDEIETHTKNDASEVSE